MTGGTGGRGRTPPPLVHLGHLQVGELLAEGGEGRVFHLPRQPHLVYKAYHTAASRSYLEDLVGWPGLAGDEVAARVRSASAWPCSVVASGKGPAVGVLLPRAPRRFALRHRDGNTRLASLSYLTSDPRHRAAAYGLRLPPPVSADRISLVYALARLLASFESASPLVAHGDLSTKNVLWSLQRGPEIFVIDCDSSELFDFDGAPVGPARRRAMTPNWDDPAVARGDNPDVASDRYSLALIFLRVVGAANFPIQARQRASGAVRVDFPVPAGRTSSVLDAGSQLWSLCSAGLSVSDPERRPPASAWLPALEATLDALGAPAAASSVRALQGGGSPAPASAWSAPDRDGDVEIVPTPSKPAPRRWRRQERVVRPGSATGGSLAGGSALQAPAAPPPVTLPTVWPDVASGLGRAARWWVSIHRALLAGVLRTGSSRSGRLRSVALCAGVDLALAVVGLFVLAMIVSPAIGL